MMSFKMIPLFFNSLDLKSKIFFVLIFIAYASQIIFQREDWPLTKLSLFSGGRFETFNLCKISIQYERGGKSIDPLLLGSDKFFIIGSLEAMMCTKDPTINEVSTFLHQNITPILVRNQVPLSGVIKVKRRYWKELVYGNFDSPEVDEIILSETPQGER